ncbi:hypothetical protein Ancab_014980 [Ancistrocladus abbreviatus]
MPSVISTGTSYADIVKQNCELSKHDHHGYQKEKQAQACRLVIKSIQSYLSWLRGSYTGVLKSPKLLLSIQEELRKRLEGHFHSVNPEHLPQEWIASADVLSLSPRAYFQPKYSREVNNELGDFSGPMERPRDPLVAEDGPNNTPSLTLPKQRDLTIKARHQARLSIKKSMDKILQLHLSKRGIGMVSTRKKYVPFHGAKGRGGNGKGVTYMGNQLAIPSFKTGIGCSMLHWIL